MLCTCDSELNKYKSIGGLATSTGRYLHSLEIHIGADSLILTVSLTLNP